jgi:hypothetical protein
VTCAVDTDTWNKQCLLESMRVEERKNKTIICLMMFIHSVLQTPFILCVISVAMCCVVFNKFTVECLVYLV